MAEKKLEKIVLAQGEDVYAFAVGTEDAFFEGSVPKNLDVLKAYILGLMNSRTYLDQKLTPEQIENGPADNSQWFYIGEPMEEKEFQEVVQYVTPDPDRNGYC
ncbi:hypothetical protein GF358_02845 [Candidatus Woesearchaeota archaeon]|nr:hypothetical protein [Candidatus Woesearchaeota archaeon]